MEKPTPTPEHESLAAFAGKWQGEETLFPSPFSPQERTGIGHCHLRMELGGFFLVSDYEETIDGHVFYRGHGVYGYDPKEERFTMHWFDSMGGRTRSPPSEAGKAAP